MKYIIAIIQPHKVEEVKESLNNHEIYRLTVGNVQGYGQQKGFLEVYRGTEKVRMVRKVRVEIAINDEFVDAAIDALCEAARTNGGKIGDGKIFVLPMEECVRIRTGERGPSAI